MADKLTQQITEALTKAAAEPAGLPLYAGKLDPGLFVSTSNGKSAAQKCLNDGLVRVVGSNTRGKNTRELYGLTENGWNFLLAQVNPKQVLEDFVRALEAQRGEVGELLDTARRMAENLQGLKDAVTRVLPSVIEGRICRSEPRFSNPELLHSPVTLPDRRAGEIDHLLSHGLRSLGNDSQKNGNLGGESIPVMERENEAVSTAVLDTPPGALATDLAAAIVTCLSDWSGAVGEDCPLPRLYRSLSTRDLQPTIGEFHDCLRDLYAAGTIYLHPWTGPLYALPEPAYALLAGHNIAYYASVRP